MVKRKSTHESCQKIKIRKLSKNSVNIQEASNTCYENLGHETADIPCLDLKLELGKIVELFKQNKLTKENVWDIKAIDLLNLLTEKIDKLDYRFIGQCLETVTKVYSLRLDSLYDDIVRMRSFVNRQGKYF